MSRAYAISKYLPLEARQAAIERHYVPNDDGCRRDTDGCCPLGVALNRLRGSRYYDTPLSDDVADIVCGLNTDDDWIYAEEAADTFIEDWDGGGIDDLAAALFGSDS